MLVQSNAEFEQVLGWIRRADVVAVDSETTGLDPWLGDRLTGVAIATQAGEAYLPFRHRTPVTTPVGAPEATSMPDGWNLSGSYLQRLLDELSGQSVCSRDQSIVFHNALFDWAVLAQDGWTPPPATRQWDTKVFSWLFDENVSHRLKDLADAWVSPLASADSGDLKRLMRKRPGRETPTWASLTPYEVAAYGEQDARLTLELYRQQAQLARQHPELGKAMAREMRLLEVLDAMTATGIRIDQEAVRLAMAERERVMAEIEARFPGVNLNAPGQLAKLLYDDWGLTCSRSTKSGARSADRQALEELVLHPERGEDVAAILEYRKASKAKVGYFEALLRFTGPDGRVHPWFNASSDDRFGTHTGRLSCSRPNLQTIPKEEVLPDVRNVFIPEPGYELWEYDLQQAEMRVAADYAQDTAMLRDLETDDLHSATAVRMFGNAQPLNRRLAKNLNFGFLYGIGPVTFAATAARGGAKISIDQAQAYLDTYAKTYPNLRRAADEAEGVARTRGYVRLWPVGRRRLYRSPGLQWPRYYTAFNAIVQGGVAELVKAAMIRLDECVASHGVRLVLQVHDSLVYEVPAGAAEPWTLAVVKAFEACNPFTVAMPVEASPWRVEAQDPVSA